MQHSATPFMDETPQVKKEYTTAEMRQRAKVARQKYAADLSKIPKLKPMRLILFIGWSLTMSSLDNTIVNVSLPSIRVDPNFVPPGQSIPLSTLQWINDIYSVAFAACAIPATKIGDRFGQTLVHRYGCFAFIIASILCGLSKFISYKGTWDLGGFWVLIVARFLQGIAAAFNMANSMALGSILVEPADIPKSIAANSLAFAIASAVGPMIGGLITQFIGWEFCFFINIFIGSAGIVLCWMNLPMTPKFVEDKMDWAGGLIVMLGLIMLILGFTFIPPSKGQSSAGIVLAVCGVFIIAAFIFWELHHPFAIIPRVLLTNKKIMYAFMAGLFNFLLITAVSFQQPFVIQTMHCITPVGSGFISLISPVTMMAGSFVGTIVGKKFTSQLVKTVCSIIVAAAVICIGLIVPYHIALIILFLAVFMFFLAIYFQSNNQFMMLTATADVRSLIGGCIQTFRETGFAVGIAMVNLFQDLYMGGAWKGREPIDRTCSDPFFSQYREVYYSGVLFTDIGMSFLCLFCLLFGWLSGTSPHERALKGFPKAKVNDQYTKIDENKPVVVPTDAVRQAPQASDAKITGKEESSDAKEVAK